MSMTEFQQSCYNIVTDPNLSPKQKSNLLALAAENNLPYVDLDEETQQALNDRVICDMYEGHAPYKPRYVLPDYVKFLKQGSKWLELNPAETFDDALNLLIIIYHHVPSVTGMPVYLGCLDQILLPYVGNLTEDEIYQRLKRFWIMLDRNLPDAFMHANIGPTDNIICRVILRIDRELKQVAPNLTFIYDKEITPESLLLVAIENICETSKPHIANNNMVQKDFDSKGYGVVSCYNSLPVAGGGSTLSRINLKEVALRSKNSEDFLTNTLPYYCQLQLNLIQARSNFLYNQSNFFNSSFLVQEGLIDPNRFAPMFGIFGMAEAVNILQEKANLAGRYGFDEQANELALTITQLIAKFIDNHTIENAWKGKAMLHSQSGISTDIGITPGLRIPYGHEPDPVTHIMALFKHHHYYTSGISDILTIDETIKNNPSALLQICKAAFKLGFREFTANISGNDLVRVTGYMVRLSDIKKYKQEGSRINTTFLGAEAADDVKNNSYLSRKPRVISHEQVMGNR
ncbi:YjjI family glycine radical enzyme [Gilliamella sp. Pas-s27]|uniref:YjjI family glycine radical enzyme n=1 Tax=Gilliamella sp. Pas-s27 TaxID=2687311 RepID=UPI001922F6BE|nr:YjjI family glycine radical enzyme [Gilliamella sp. Pas-s27]